MQPITRQKGTAPQENASPHSQGQKSMYCSMRDGGELEEVEVEKRVSLGRDATSLCLARLRSSDVLSTFPLHSLLHPPPRLSILSSLQTFRVAAPCPSADPAGQKRVPCRDFEIGSRALAFDVGRMGAASNRYILPCYLIFPLAITTFTASYSGSQTSTSASWFLLFPHLQVLVHTRVIISLITL
ncbi:hypothetical protein CVT26_007737 [Gymnopilus dilepis]|uniref:Uncharacterized protein n=1 Tax=Gymnopilus dilepis TaxID=231916 RepID=A0A409WLF4_9AGAR|nr:hypothetical protein CVT26_007737 [Gymnopilus dilepis]